MACFSFTGYLTLGKPLSPRSLSFTMSSWVVSLPSSRAFNRDPWLKEYSEENPGRMGGIGRGRGKVHLIPQEVLEHK